ncbi:MAG TPA: hypothetical protein ENI97_11095 [Gammaproteobacteria bacterium]|nr:hypothetical protein [Gammaproteobacteria bacterium]
MTIIPQRRKQRFLCDEMLRKLGHWLRAAGYDTVIAVQGTRDRDLLQQAIAEDRLLITRDQKLTEYREAPGVVLLLHSNDIHDCARELRHILNIDWFYKPFSRCLLCNTELIPADPVCIEQVPRQSRATITTLFCCPHCEKLYWQGSHVRRLSKMFRQWMDG